MRSKIMAKKEDKTNGETAAYLGENKYFREALKNFTYDSASGGAIEHLAGLGYLPQEIEKMLDFPTPYRQIQEYYRDYLVKNKIIVEEKEELSAGRKKEYFVADYDSYGRKTFRQVVEYEKEAVAGTYVSCDFGLRMRADPDGFAKFIEPLNDKQRMYIEGIPWRQKIVWHLMDQRMTEIINILREKSGYHCTIIN
jgi:hypothetical protein